MLLSLLSFQCRIISSEMRILILRADVTEKVALLKKATYAFLTAESHISIACDGC